MRETTLNVYTCPTRRSPPVVSIAGDVLQGTSNPHVPGGVGDYAACVGDAAVTSDYYLGLNGTTSANCANGAFQYKHPTTQLSFRDFTDGLSNTFFVGEKHVTLANLNREGSMYNGDHGSSFRKIGVGIPLARSITSNSGQFGSWHPGVCQFVMGDGSVVGINVSANTTTLGYLANRHDGQTVQVP